MYRVALNVAISHYRKEMIKQETLPLAESMEAIKEEPDTTSDSEQNGQQLQRFINELKELDRALVLLYLEEKPYREIGEILGITETNVATKINRIKDKLKLRFATIN
jgi:RNA polymerase sigma factor (sigma-70 family)